jgi:thiamine-phosphate pyrophosphorylase
VTTVNTKPKSIGRLHVIVDTVHLAEAALKGGASVVQVRLKSNSDRRRFAVTQEIVERCAQAGTPCIVNDRLDMALAAGADGVHLGGDDLPVNAARRVCPDGFVIGASALGTTAPVVIDAVANVAEYVDYVGVGPVYATRSKDDIPEPMGETELAKIVPHCHVPVIAISGITAERIPAVHTAGAWGIAVIGAVAQAPDPVQAVVQLREALESVQHVPRRRTPA